MVEAVDHPEPLVPAECDVATMPYMPMDLARVLNSDLLIESTGDEFKAAFILWAKSFHCVSAWKFDPVSGVIGV